MNKLDISKWDLRQRILATLAYFDIFEMPLESKDCSKLILGSQHDNHEISAELTNLGLKIHEHEGRFTLTNSKEFSDQFLKYKTKASALLEKAQKCGKLFKYIPFVEFAAVCNYLPLGIADDDSDIDLFIIAKKDRIFLARIFATLVLHCLRLRRHGRKVSGRFCLSFYISEGHLDLRDLFLAEDIYFAYWLIALRPIYGKQSIWADLQHKNANWLTGYFVGNRYEKNDFAYRKTWWRLVAEVILNGKFGNWVENTLAKFFQKRHHNKKGLPVNASIVVSNTRLKFHNNDRRLFFLNEWEKRLEGLGFFE